MSRVLIAWLVDWLGVFEDSLETLFGEHYRPPLLAQTLALTELNRVDLSLSQTKCVSASLCTRFYHKHATKCRRLVLQANSAAVSLKKSVKTNYSHHPSDQH